MTELIGLDKDGDPFDYDWNCLLQCHWEAELPGEIYMM